MGFALRLMKNELLSLSTIFLVLVPALNHLMINHGGPDLSNLSISSLTGGNFSGALSGLGNSAHSAGMYIAQANGGSAQIYINHSPIFLN